MKGIPSKNSLPSRLNGPKWKTAWKRSFTMHRHVAFSSPHTNLLVMLSWEADQTNVQTKPYVGNCTLVLVTEFVFTTNEVFDEGVNSWRIGIGYSGRWQGHHPWRCWRNDWIVAQCCALVHKVGIGHSFESMILDVFSNLKNSMVLLYHRRLSWSVAIW